MEGEGGEGGNSIWHSHPRLNKVVSIQLVQSRVSLALAFLVFQHRNRPSPPALLLARLLVQIKFSSTVKQYGAWRVGETGGPTRDSVVLRYRFPGNKPNCWMFRQNVPRHYVLAHNGIPLSLIRPRTNRINYLPLTRTVKLYVTYEYEYRTKFDIAVKMA